jgi:hypothetical protein
MEAIGHTAMEFSSCKVPKPANCAINEPLLVGATGKSLIINEAKEKEEMASNSLPGWKAKSSPGSSSKDRVAAAPLKNQAPFKSEAP